MIILLVDDEFPTRQQLQYVLEQLVPEAQFYQASNGDEALAMLSYITPDVVFLDINMPGKSGLETLGLIVDRPNPPLIVFATAYEKYALQAFELDAFDYVVKPFSKRRLESTVARIRQRVGEQKTLTQQKELIQKFLRESQQEKTPEKLWVEQPNNNRLLVEIEEIAYVESRNKQTYIHMRSGEEWLARYTLKELETRLEPQRFCRIHRAYLVNTHVIAELIPWFSGGYQVRLNTEAQVTLPVSRRHAQAVKSLFRQ